MASRWLAMICACQTRAMDIKLMETTQNIRARPTADSLAGRRKTRRSQAMVRDLLVLGSICSPSLARIRVGSAGGIACASLSQGNREAKALGIVRPFYPTQNNWFVKPAMVIHSVIRIAGVQFDAHLCNIFSEASSFL